MPQRCFATLRVFSSGGKALAFALRIAQQNASAIPTLEDKVKTCKHNLESGCCYCHGSALAELNSNQESAKRSRRAERYAARLTQAMNREGPLALRDGMLFRRVGSNPITRSAARWTMNQYGGN